MGLSINGFGTRHYGKKWQDDGTYLTTKYFVFLWIPIFKLDTVRVRPLYPREINSGLTRSRFLTTLRDFVYLIVMLGLVFLGLPHLLAWWRGG